MTTCARCGAELPEHARFCPACGAAAEAVPVSEERKLATVVFADLVGSTALAGTQDPERTRALLDRFYEAMREEIERAGGTVEKFAGDAVMAAFGAPAAQEDHAERALHAAIAMRRRLGELFDGALALRIGVNTGEVVVGRPHEGSSFVTGDPVNVAARLEQAAEPGEILAGERTVAAVRGAFEFDTPATVEAKGKPGGVACSRLVRALSLMRPRGVSGLGTPFVGRESELALLQATYDRVVRQREPHLVTILGDAGVGKTRLLRELWQWLAAQSPQPLQRTGRCVPYGQFTYWALGEVLKEHLGIFEGDEPESVLRRLEGREILGLALGLDVAGELHPLAARDRLHEAWVAFLHELGADRPAVVLIEDLHWAEEPLLDLLERLVRDVRAPLLLLATARPELLDRRGAWGGGRRNTSLLWLEPLSEDDSRRLLDELLASQLPERLLEAIVAGAEGNPFFVEELVAALIDRGVLARANGGWVAAELPAGFVVPDSVQAILAARIDLLGPTEKAGLQAASVIGRIFWKSPLRELLDGAEPDCGVLEDRDFIRRRAGSSIQGEIEYAFKHALTREVSYASLPKARRARLHARFAGWLETFGAGRDEYASLLAHHYSQAARPEDADLAWRDEAEELARLRRQARTWLRRAASLAVARYELDDGLALLERALELDEHPEAQAELWREIGRAHALKYDGPPFWEAMERSLAVCSDRATCGETYAELAFQTATRSGMWKRRPDDELIGHWVERALELAEPGSAARAKALLARVYWEQEPPEADAIEASALAEGLGDPDLRVTAWGARASTALAYGRYEEALTWAQRPFEVVNEVRDPEVLTDIQYMPIPACVMLGRFREARRLARRYDELSRRLPPHHRLHGVAVLLELEELVGGWERIRELERRTEEAVGENLETPCIRNPRSLLVCALAHAYAGDATAAGRLEQKAREVWMEGYGGLVNPLLLRLALERGDLDAAADVLPEPASTPLSFWFGLSGRSARLDGLAALGDPKGVEQEAEGIPERTYLEPFALRALALVREDEALLGRALERFDELGLAWHAEQTRTRL